METPKPLFHTTTAKGAMLAIAGSVLLALANTGAKIASRHFPQSQADIADCLDYINYVGLLLGVGGGLGALAGRASAVAPTYTPSWLPGANKADFFNADGTPKSQTTKPEADDEASANLPK